MKCPCKDCVVFAMCNIKIKDERPTKLVIIGLATTCPILMEFLTVTESINLDNENIGTTRRIYGWEGE